jgi:maltooligosyltrehalose synthase
MEFRLASQLVLQVRLQFALPLTGAATQASGSDCTLLAKVLSPAINRRIAAQPPVRRQQPAFASMTGFRKGLENPPAGSFNLLEGLLSQQVFRLSFWKMAAEEIDYRRFFCGNGLISLWVENEHVLSYPHWADFRSDCQTLRSPV